MYLCMNLKLYSILVTLLAIMTEQMVPAEFQQTNKNVDNVMSVRTITEGKCNRHRKKLFQNQKILDLFSQTNAARNTL
jgi:hypothetical protein